MSRPIFGIADIARAWGVSGERIRQLRKANCLPEPDLFHATSETRAEYFWLAIPERNDLRYQLAAEAKA